MSTRSVTIVMKRGSEDGEIEGVELFRFYRHCDGYPEGHGYQMAMAFTQAMNRVDLYDRNWVQECFADLFAAQCNLEVEPREYVHSDIEYLYVVGGPYSVREDWVTVERHGVEIAVYDACIDGWLRDEEWSYDKVLEHKPLFSGTPSEYAEWVDGGMKCEGSAVCTACGAVADCNQFNVKGYLDDAASEQHVDWVGCLCGECEMKLLVMLGGGAE